MTVYEKLIDGFEVNWLREAQLMGDLQKNLRYLLTIRTTYRFSCYGFRDNCLVILLLLLLLFPILYGITV